MRKKWILWVTCLALTLGTYTGCSKSSDEPQTQPEETIEQEAEQTEDPQEESKESEQVEEINEQEEAEAPEEKETAKAEEPKEEQPAAETKDTPQTSPAPAPAEEQPASVLEESAPAEEPQGIADGTYTISIGFSGGTGKASITSPVTLYVKNGTYSAKVVWTSINYDYMIVNGTKYTNENVGGNSTFTIPVPALDTYFTVIGDTTAMSTPHEIEYTLYFDSTTLK